MKIGGRTTQGRGMRKAHEQITDDEKKILDALEQNAKESIDNMAKRFGFSRQKIWRIIKHFEENNTIWGYVGVENEEAKGLKHFVLLVKRSTMPIDPSSKKEITLSKLDSLLPESLKIENVYLTHGAYDGVITFYAPDLITAKRLIQALTQNIGLLFEEFLLLETLISSRKNGLKNPQMENLIEFL